MSYGAKAENLKSEGDILLGSLYICLSATMFAVAGVAVKSAVADIGPVVLVFWRNVLSFFLIIAVILASSRYSVKEFATKKIKFHMARAVFSMMVLYSYFYAVSKLSLGTAVLFLSTGPIFIPILALVFFKHLSDREVWIGIFIAFVGVSLIVRPTSVFISSGILFGLISGLFGGASTLTIWSMSNTESAVKQLFYFSIFCVVLSIPLAFWQWKWPAVDTYLPIAVLGVSTTLAQYFLSKGFSLAPADKIYTWNYLSIVISSLAAYIGWGEKLGALTIAGMVFVVIGARMATLKFKRRAMQGS